MDDDTVHMWTAECLESIKDTVDHASLLPVMSKIIWAITQAYQAGQLDIEDGEPSELALENVRIAATNRMLNDEITNQHQRRERDAALLTFVRAQLAQMSVLPCRVDEMTPREFEIFKLVTIGCAALQYVQERLEIGTPPGAPDGVWG